jgi:hypothetical protein
MSAGFGPACPADNRHGRLYQWDRGSNPDKKYICVHQAHGGNGKTFSESEAQGNYTLGERDVSMIYESAARDVVSGTSKEEAVIKDIAKQTKTATTQVREKLHLMMAVVREEDRKKEMAKMAAEQATKAAKAPKTPKTPKAPATPRIKLEHVEGAKFDALRNELGLTTTQVRAACEAAGMGKSSTYVYIILHEGASSKLFARYEAALAEYVESQKTDA